MSNHTTNPSSTPPPAPQKTVGRARFFYMFFVFFTTNTSLTFIREGSSVQGARKKNTVCFLLPAGPVGRGRPGRSFQNPPRPANISLRWIPRHQLVTQKLVFRFQFLIIICEQQKYLLACFVVSKHARCYGEQCNIYIKSVSMQPLAA